MLTKLLLRTLSCGYQERGEHSNCKTLSPCQLLEPSLVTFGNGKLQIELPSPRAAASASSSPLLPLHIRFPSQFLRA
ncbi:hypothetical protein STEG23_007217, partial [Scotinomys teguina]